MTLFYDGHVEGVGVRRAMRADGRMRNQTGNADWGLWSKDTGLDRAAGYFIPQSYDQADTSFQESWALGGVSSSSGPGPGVQAPRGTAGGRTRFSP